MKEITKVYRGSKNGVDLNITFEEDSVIFDFPNSDNKIIKLPLEILEKSIDTHINKISRRNFQELRDKYKK